MKLLNRVLFLSIVSLIAAIGFGCQQPASNTTVSTNSGVTKTVTKVDVGGAKSPTEAYTMLYTAVKAGDIDSVKKMVSKASLGMAESAAQRQNKTAEEVLKNGFTATTFSDTIPEIRDPRIKDNFASVEVRNEKENKWEDLPFVLEDGSWKLAVGDLFAGTFKSPGPSKAVLDQINSNKSNPNAGMIKGGNTNTTPINVTRPKMPDEMRQPPTEKK